LRSLPLLSLRSPSKIVLLGLFSPRTLSFDLCASLEVLLPFSACGVGGLFLPGFLPGTLRSCAFSSLQRFLLPIPPEFISPRSALGLLLQSFLL
jgi:hypothetical protein